MMAYQCSTCCNIIDELVWSQFCGNCKSCFPRILPFNHLASDDFDLAILQFKTDDKINIDRLKNLKFNPFTYNNSFANSDDLDPDKNYYHKSYNTSEYYLLDQFVEKFKVKNSKNTFSCFHQNARSFGKNFDSIIDFINILQYQFHVIGFSETWLDDNSPDFCIKDYSCVKKDRQEKTGGGVALYVHNSLNFCVRNDIKLQNSTCDCLFVEIPRTQGKNIIVGTIYKPPTFKVDEFVTDFENILVNINKENKISYVMGDFNIDLLKYCRHNPTKNFVNSLFSNSHLPLINRPTRITSTTATLIDNIISNSIDGKTESGILFNDISDHLSVFQISSIDAGGVSEFKRNYSGFRRITPENIQSFKLDLEHANWNFTSMDDPNEAFDNFQSKFLKLYENSFPLQKAKSRKKLKSWMTDGVINSIKHKNKLYKKYLNNPTPNNFCAYKLFRNKLNTIIKVSKAKFYNDKFEKAKNNAKNTWNVINSLLNKKKCTDAPSKFKIEGNPTSNSRVIANAFNNYFTQVGPSLNRNIPHTNIQYEAYLRDPNEHSLFLNPITESEICDIVSKFKNKSPGIDDIKPSLIKSVITYISDPLCHIFNLSLTTGIFPKKLKVAKVTPVFKNGDPAELGNYRPISVLSCLSKILEKLVFNRTMNFLQKYNILTDNQYGFRSNYSTSLALLDFADKIIKGFEDNVYSIGIFLDLSKAFDTINHNIFLDNLSY